MIHHDSSEVAIIYPAIFHGWLDLRVFTGDPPAVLPSLLQQRAANRLAPRDSWNGGNSQKVKVIQTLGF